MSAEGSLTVFGIVLVLLVILGVTSCEIVDPGHRGVRVTAGSVSPEFAKEGLTAKLPWTSIHEVNVQQQTVAGDAPCFSKDLQQVQVKYALMYKVPEAAVVKLYQDFKGDILPSLVEPRVQEALKQVTAQHNAEELVQQREIIRQAALERVKAMIGENVTIVDLNVTNIDLSDQLEHAIEQKMVKQQESLAKNYELDKEKKQAEITLIQAKAEAESIVVKAAALAQSPNVIDLEIIKKWDGKAPTTLVVGEGKSGANVVYPIGKGAK